MTDPAVSLPQDPAIRRAYLALKKYIDVTIGALTLGATDHGALTGLGDDDHSQYHNDTRGDARYLKLAGGTVTGASTFSNTLTASGTFNSTGTHQRNGTAVKQLVSATGKIGTANLTTSATPTVVPGMTVTLSLVSGDIVTVTAGVDVESTVAATTTTSTLYVAGAMYNAAQCIMKSTAVGDRKTVANNWVYTAGATGNVTFEIKSSHTVGGATVRGASSSMTLCVFR